MDFRYFVSASVAALVLLSVVGCKKPESVSNPPVQPPTPAIETVARMHWLGQERVAGDTNGASFLDIWKLPASQALGEQTLGKLSLAPWRLFKGDAATNGAPIARFRTLLDDLVREESYLEIRNATNEPGELAFAIRLGPDRAGLWTTNLAMVMESLTGIQPVMTTNGRGWMLRKHDLPKCVELTRAGEWTLVGLAPETNTLLNDLLARIDRDRVPFGARATNFWFEAALDLRRISSALALGWNLPEASPRVSVSVVGHKSGVRTEGELQLARLLPSELEPWNIPTNLIQGPLVGFTAVRGVKPWLSSLESLGIKSPVSWPDQFCLWSRAGFVLQTYCAAPLPDASNQVTRLREKLIQEVNPWLITNGLGRFEPLPTTNHGVWWSGLPIMHAFVESVHSTGGDFALGGMLPPVQTNRWIQPELLQAIFDRPNLVAYDWEITQDGIESWLFFTQILRLAFHKAQLPADSASMAWLKSAGLQMGNTVTLATKTGPAQISFLRQSSFGLTAAEIHLLVDWLESPRFPLGLNTFVAPPESWQTNQPSSQPKKP